MEKKNSLKIFEQKLRADRALHRAFLGSDQRSLTAILRADETFIRRRGWSHARIVRRLTALRQAGWQGQGNPVAVPPHWAVKVEAERGYLACPFGDKSSVAKVNTTVHNLSRGLEITFSDLNLHLIAAHGFYEGRGAAFRLDPQELLDTLAPEKKGNRSGDNPASKAG